MTYDRANAFTRHLLNFREGTTYITLGGGFTFVPALFDALNFSRFKFCVSLWSDGLYPHQELSTFKPVARHTALVKRIKGLSQYA